VVFRIGKQGTAFAVIKHCGASAADAKAPCSPLLQATDGTLFPSAARYHGCTNFDDCCASIRVDNVAEKIIRSHYDLFSESLNYLYNKVGYHPGYCLLYRCHRS
jgi:hypothetical protein